MCARSCVCACLCVTSDTPLYAHIAPVLVVSLSMSLPRIAICSFPLTHFSAHKYALSVYLHLLISSCTHYTCICVKVKLKLCIQNLSMFPHFITLFSSFDEFSRTNHVIIGHFDSWCKSVQIVKFVFGVHEWHSCLMTIFSKRLIDDQAVSYAWLL